MKSSEIVSFVRNIPNGRMIGITWVKVDGSLRTASATFGVKNPSGTVAPGQGVRSGVGFAEAASKGVLKFFDTNAINRNGTKGDYRSAKIDRIVKISYNGEHIIEDNQHLIN